MDEDRKRTVSILDQEIKRTMSSYVQKSMSRLKVRRQSFGFANVVSGIGPGRTSNAGQESKRPVLMYLNTYQLDPRVKFDPKQVTKVTETLLDEVFTDHTYNRETSPELALHIANDLLYKVKAMEFNRYRILTIVTIAQDRAQCYTNAISFVWDDERDGYSNVQREVRGAFIQITMFGIYLD